MAGSLLPVPVPAAGSRLPVLWVPPAPGGGPRPVATERLALPTGSRAALSPGTLGAVVRFRPPGAEEAEAPSAGPPSTCPPVTASAAVIPIARVRRSWRLPRPVRALVQAAMAAATAAVGLVVVGALTGAWGFVPVLTGSMRPGIQPGDLVLVLPEPLSAVGPGQILDFQPPGQDGTSVVHRVLSVTSSADGPVIHTKGDANNTADPWTSSLAGTRAWRVSAVIPKLGYLSVAEHNRAVRTALELGLLLGGLGTALTVKWGRRIDQAGDREPVPTGVAAG